MNPLTEEDIYIGNFLIDIYNSIQEYIGIYRTDPVSVGVDSRHYKLLQHCSFGNWINQDTMKLRNGILVEEEKRWVGSYTSIRGPKRK